jgi:hypothetical protein
VSGIIPHPDELGEHGRALLDQPDLPTVADAYAAGRADERAAAITGWTARAVWQHNGGARELTVTSERGPLAIIPLPDDGRPSMGTLDDLLAVLGYTRTSPWSPTAPALVADCEPIRPDVS